LDVLCVSCVGGARAHVMIGREGAGCMRVWCVVLFAVIEREKEGINVR
jgi:hypothetical protein